MKGVGPCDLFPLKAEAGGQPGQPLPLNNQADTTSYVHLFSFLLGREKYRQHEVTTVLARCHQTQQAAQIPGRGSDTLRQSGKGHTPCRDPPKPAAFTEVSFLYFGA